MMTTLSLDLQVHSRFSPSCGWLSIDDILETAAANGLDGVAITDHNTMAGYRRAVDRSPPEFHVLPAVEIDTTEGQIIGLFVDDPIDPWQSPAETIDGIHDQGGIAVLPHPFDCLREGLVSSSSHADRIDAVETLNSRCVAAQSNELAAAFASHHGIPAVGGSDAHFAHEIGTAYTEVELEADDPNAVGFDAIREALLAGDARPVGSRGTVLSHAGTKAVKLYNLVRRKL